MNAWRDYFQMGELTGWLTVEIFCSCIAHNPVLHAHYLYTYMEEDAKCVSLLHEDVHGISGMLGSLDCMHVFEELPHCIPRSIPGKGEVLHSGAGGNRRSQLMVLACCIWFCG